MKATIRKKCYDTETATLLGSYTSGGFGDPAGFEERLYETPEGFRFLYGNGGESSPYPEEQIRSISKLNSQKWLAEHAPANGD